MQSSGSKKRDVISLYVERFPEPVDPEVSGRYFCLPTQTIWAVLKFQWWRAEELEQLAQEALETGTPIDWKRFEAQSQQSLGLGEKAVPQAA
jgi:hypothetical protein